MENGNAIFKKTMIKINTGHVFKKYYAHILFSLYFRKMERPEQI